METAILKRQVLRCLRKEAILSQDFSVVGSSFQKMGAATEPPASFFFGVYSWLVKVLGQFSIIYFRGLELRIVVRVWVRVRVGVRVWVRVRVRVRVRVSVVLWSG